MKLPSVRQWRRTTTSIRARLRIIGSSQRDINRETGGKWRVVSEEVWPYPLPPIIHWQNLPMVGNAWGMPDISDECDRVAGQE